MKRLLAGIILAVCFLGGPAMATNCSPSQTYTYFMKEAQGIRGITIMEFTPKGREVYLAYVNKYRASQKLFLYEADRIMWGYGFKYQGKPSVGVVLFADNCVLPGTMETKTMDDWVDYMVNAGVTPDMSKPWVK